MSFASYVRSAIDRIMHPPLKPGNLFSNDRYEELAKRQDETYKVQLALLSLVNLTEPLRDVAKRVDLLNRVSVRPDAAHWRAFYHEVDKLISFDKNIVGYYARYAADEVFELIELANKRAAYFVLMLEAFDAGDTFIAAKLTHA